jgi:hypothetical protein
VSLCLEDASVQASFRGGPGFCLALAAQTGRVQMTATGMDEATMGEMMIMTHITYWRILTLTLSCGTEDDKYKYNVIYIPGK